MCIFCKKLWSKLSNHIKNCHKDNQTVKEILKLNKTARAKEFQKLKRAGIVEFNKAEALKEEPVYQGEKKRRKFQDLVICSNCSSFISRRFFSLHKRRCTRKFDSPSVSLPMYEQNLTTQQPLSDEFVTSVLAKVRTDELGTLVRKDVYILFLGFKHFNKNKHKKSKIATVRKTARSEMRLLASMYRTARTYDGFDDRHGNIIDLFIRENFNHLSDAVLEMSHAEEGEMKAGLRQTIFYLIIKSCKRLRDRFFIEKKEELSKEIDSFLKSVKSSEDIFLSSAQYLLEQNASKRPENLVNCHWKEMFRSWGNMC